MIYKFKSKASGDIIMLGPQGDRLLVLLGREPAARGIIEPRDMPEAIRVLQQAIARAESGEEAGGTDDGAGDGRNEPAVGLRQRLWPMIDMLQRAAAAEVPVVWGV